jgi:DNA-binding SARP family transcriptional activator/tetratricopeptide (TPR) repeat protein
MEIHLLGAVGLSAHGSAVRLGSDRERCLLAALALSVGRPVTQDDLVARLWDDDPPMTARANLHTYISKLRRVLRESDGPADTANRPPTAITLRAHAYTLEADPQSVDWHRYLRLAGQARSTASGSGTAGAASAASADDARTLALLEEADALWIGEALAGLPGDWARSSRAAMGERRLSAIRTRLELRMRLGQFEDAVSELAALTEQYPMDETLARHLMVALYGCGRHADALAVYQRTWRRLRDRIGTAPGGRLADAHALVLRQAALRDLVPGLHAEPPAQPRPAGPCNLPRRPQLVGRAEELDRILSADGAPGSAGSVVTIEAISGMPGVGKSALAVHAAYRLAERFPDAQLFVDLRSHKAGQPPLTAEAGLTALLRAYGIAPHAIPHDPQERAALWRTVLAGKRAVVVLDDARNSDQVIPLLPDDSASLVLITSRHRLTELPSARPMFVDILPLGEAIALFRRLVGPERATDTDKITEIVERCARLPLAVEIVASRFKGRPSWNLGHLIERLSRRPGRLREIHDGCREMAAAFEMSYTSLSRPQRAAFRRLSLHPGPDFGPHAAAALLGEPVGRAERLVEDLIRCHLIQEPRPERVRYHDLLGEFAAELAESEETPGDRAAAALRLTAYALHAADRAGRLLHPHRARLDPPAPSMPVALPVWPDAAAARGWLTDELEGLLAVEQRARQDGNAREAAWLAHALADFADSEGYWQEAVAMHRAAAAHWRAAGDARAEGRALLDLAAIHSGASRYPESAEAAERALTLARACGDDTGAAEALSRLGVLHWHVGEYGAGLVLHQQCLDLRVRAGENPWLVSRALNNIGIGRLYMGEYASALENFSSALEKIHGTGDVETESKYLNNIGDLRLRTGNTAGARTAFEKSLTLGAESWDETSRAVARMNIAGTIDSQEEFETALDLYRTSLAIFRRTGDRRNTASALNGLGTTLRNAAHHAEAKIHHENALRVAREIGAAYEEAAALRGTGVAELALGQTKQARAHVEAAAALALRIGAPEQEALAADALAQMALDAGRPEEARELWLHALTLFAPLNEQESDRIRRVLIDTDQNTSGDWQREA